MRETPFIFCPKAALGVNDSSGTALEKRFLPALGSERHPEMTQVRKTQTKLHCHFNPCGAGRVLWDFS